MSEGIDFDDEMASPVLTSRPAANSKELPHSIEAERRLLSCCLIDNGISFQQAIDSGITAQSFYDSNHRLIWSKLEQIKNPSVETLIIELQQSGQLAVLGGATFLIELSNEQPTTAHAAYFTSTVRNLSERRRIIRLSQLAAERAQRGDDLREIEGILKSTSFESVGHNHKERPLFDFKLVPDNDNSILLGNRYLNRGDGAVIVSSSGMGKSALSLQMATELALDRSPFGIKGNGFLTSLVIQSEDTDGDVAEVAHSLRHVLNLTDKEIAQVNERVKIISDRTNRGPRFISALKRHIEQVKPDLVWINPLQAFIDGDVTDSKDIGAFLREGLNGLNHESKFGYIIVHHTTKPAKDPKGGATPKWSEVMYDMAGGAEIINWARAIISLRATEIEGNFNMVLAKRGRRAGVTREVDQGAGTRLETITTIPLKHSTGRIEVEGIQRGLPLIYWESREPDEQKSPETKKGRPKSFGFAKFRDCFPACDQPAKASNQIFKLCKQVDEISDTSFRRLCAEAVEEGFLTRKIDHSGVFYRQTTAAGV